MGGAGQALGKAWDNLRAFGQGDRHGHLFANGSPFLGFEIGADFAFVVLFEKQFCGFGRKAHAHRRLIFCKADLPAGAIG